jgi:broad specificity phosphatase PhoE
MVSRALAPLLVGALASALAAPLGAAAPTTAAATTVVLVRHAEKASGDDPPLSAAGRDRAETLRRTLGDAGIDAVFATPPRRTRETAEPLARALGLEIRVVPVGDDYAAEQAKLLRALPPGGVAVVVSHSNTVPAILGALGVPPPPQIPDDVYDDLFVVTLPVAGPPTMLHLRYGRARGST